MKTVGTVILGNVCYFSTRRLNPYPQYKTHADPKRRRLNFSLGWQVIEVIIRHEEGLARDVVKHLQRIEEQILECRAWASTSPLWEAIRFLPTYQSCGSWPPIYFRDPDPESTLLDLVLELTLFRSVSGIRIRVWQTQKNLKIHFN